MVKTKLNHIRNISDEQALKNGCTYDAEAADKAVSFIEKFCYHGKGDMIGKPFLLSEWQKTEIVKPIFGWKDKDGRRRFKNVFVQVAKKNGKTSLASSIVLTLLFLGSDGQEIYSIANTAKQAGILAEIIKGMLKYSPLKQYCKIYRREILIPSKSSKYQILSSDAGSNEGLNPSCVVADELAFHDSRDLYDALISGMASRGITGEPPLMLSITTAGWNQQSVARELYDLGKKVNSGEVINESVLAYICEPDKGDNWKKQSTWKKSNPNLGVSVSLDFLRSECDMAKSVANKQNAFRMYHLNEWMQHYEKWIDPLVWDLCFDEVVIDGPCYAGLDLSSKTDLTAFVLVQPMPEGKHKCVPYFYVPEDNIPVRVRDDGVAYNIWLEKNHIIATPGNVIDQDFLEGHIKQLAEDNHIKQLVFDPWGAQGFIPRFENIIECVEFPQTVQRYSPIMKEFEALVLSKKIFHNGNPCLRWCLENLIVKTDHNQNIFPSKRQAKSNRIDGITALLMALSQSILDDFSGDCFNKEELNELVENYRVVLL